MQALHLKPGPSTATGSHCRKASAVLPLTLCVASGVLAPTPTQHPHTDELSRALLPSWRRLLGKRHLCPAWFYIGSIKEDWITFSQLVLKWEV